MSIITNWINFIDDTIIFIEQCQTLERVAEGEKLF
jgi:hypothetical protein|tara:strand:- start:212 stop:316 length:105 start_codon:yes stop_codon:yes gene_type:complete